MKKIFAVILLLLVLGAGLGLFWFSRTFTVIDKTVYTRNTAELKLSGDTLPELSRLQELPRLEILDARAVPISLAEYRMLSEALPGCEIRWQVPFQGSRYSEAETSLTVTSLTEADVEALACFPNLKTVNALGCRDYEALAALKASCPELEISYTVAIGPGEYRETTTELTLENADAQAVLSALPYLPALENVTFTGQTPANEAIAEMMTLRPDVTFHYDFTVFGVETSSDATELDLSGIPMESTAAVEETLKFFNCLERVDMCGCGISSQEMDALSQRHPETRFIWTVQIGRAEIRTDITAFIPYKYGYEPNGNIRNPLLDAKQRLFDEDCVDLKYCVDMVCLDLGHMGITDYSFLANMPRLKYLILADTRGTDFSALANHEELVYLELFLTDFNQTEVLLTLPKLEDLNLGYTLVDSVEDLTQMTWLKRFWLPGSKVSREDYYALADALPDTKVVRYAEHSTAEGWRDSQNYYDMRDMLGMPYLS